MTAVTLPGPVGWLTAVTIQIDCRAASKEIAFARAIEARKRLLSLPFVDWTEGVITEVRIIEDATWLADPDGGPRYYARYEVIAHPPQSG